MPWDGISRAMIKFWPCDSESLRYRSYMHLRQQMFEVGGISELHLPKYVIYCIYTAYILRIYCIYSTDDFQQLSFPEAKYVACVGLSPCCLPPERVLHFQALMCNDMQLVTRSQLKISRVPKVKGPGYFSWGNHG